MSVSKANGIEIAWDAFGEAGDEAVLLIAGLGTQMIRWSRSFCEALAARGYRVVRFDNRDSGGSTHLAACAAPDFGALVSALVAGRRPDVPYTLGDMAADAVGLLDALGIARAHFVGRSMGGVIAQIVASEYPDRTLSLTSIMASTGNPALPQADADIMAMMMRPAPDPATDPAGYLAVRLAFARRIAGRSRPFDETLHRALLLEELRRSHDPAGTARQMAAMAVAGDRRAGLGAITSPTLIIHGSEDPLIPPACGEDTARSIPNATYWLVPGMGHDVPPDLEESFVEAIRRVANAGPEGILQARRAEAHRADNHPIRTHTFPHEAGHSRRLSSDGCESRARRSRTRTLVSPSRGPQ
ncbi:alpha/beta hydrolase [Rhizobiales bacterium Sp-1]|uniref:Alpha/beta hydrolase n=1 Tax=Segnochrobactrum spirostomi TaxID=2608987 RepID=A0A6A7Y8D3_9HYPH|nr:alpha/beta hydrolase [Segnochrobactrum spirostomi]